MSDVFLTPDGRAVIFDRATGEKMACSVPTALENVQNGGGRWVHGETGEAWDGEVATPVAPEGPIALSQDDVLPLPAAETPVVQPAPAPPAVDPLDHDGNGKKGGAKRSTDPERKAVMAELRSRGVKFFAGAKTEDLKALLVE